jgi:hypothetical protein
LFDDGAVLWGAGDGDAAAAAEPEQAFVAELAECAQDGVGVDAEDRGEVSGRWQAFAGFGFAVGDGAADFAGDLLVELGALVVFSSAVSGAPVWMSPRLAPRILVCGGGASAQHTRREDHCLVARPVWR